MNNKYINNYFEISDTYGNKYIVHVNKIDDIINRIYSCTIVHNIHINNIYPYFLGNTIYCSYYDLTKAKRIDKAIYELLFRK